MINFDELYVERGISTHQSNRKRQMILIILKAAWKSNIVVVQVEGLDVHWVQREVGAQRLDHPFG